MRQKSARLFLRTQDQPKVFNGVQRFRTVSRQALFHRGTMRRGGLGVRSILRFASELKNRLLHIFRLEAKASRSGRRKEHVAQEPRDRARRVEDINGKGSAVAERKPFMPQTVLLRCQCGRRSSMRAKREVSRRPREAWVCGGAISLSVSEGKAVPS